MKKIFKIVLITLFILGVSYWCYENRISLIPDEKLVEIYFVNEEGYNYDEISIEIDDNENLDDYEYIHYWVYVDGETKWYCSSNTDHLKRTCEKYI